MNLLNPLNLCGIQFPVSNRNDHSYSQYIKHTKETIMNSDFSRIPIAVIGLGLMGGSFAKRLKELGHPVIGLNRTESVAQEAGPGNRGLH